MATDFVPILYLKQGCPHCFKVRLFLLEAGLVDGFAVREFAPGDGGEAAIRAELTPFFAKVTFPTVQTAPGRYMSESDDIVAHYAGVHGINPATLPLFTTYAGTLLPRLRSLRTENAALRQQIEAAAS